jgi:SpoVK/Ycf46/Vps4 family AAA+-type ATPase
MIKEKSQIEKVIEACKVAIQANIPVIYLVTEEIELVEEIVNTGGFVPLLHKKPDGNNDKQNPYYTQDEWEEVTQKDPSRKLNKADNTQIDFTTNIFTGKFTILPASDVPQIRVIMNSHLTCDAKSISKYIRDYIMAQRGDAIRKMVLILVSPILQIPQGLESYIEVITVDYLEDWEIKSLVMDYISKDLADLNEPLPDKDYLNKIIVAMRGLGKRKIRELLSRIRIEIDGIVKNRRDDRSPKSVALKIIETEKKQMLEKSGFLKNVDLGEKTAEGLDYLKKWIDDCKKILDNSKIVKDEWNIDAPKGILISGIPGTGKSLMAKETARRLQLPLIQFNISTLLNKYMGQTDANMRRALKMVEAMAPCVLWIDEIEKEFSGVQGRGEADGGTSNRIFGTFLTWMQEKKASCFVFATSNKIRYLPSEFFRNGRFDKKYFSFMPMQNECIQIFKGILGNQKGLIDPDIISDDFLKDILDYCVSDNKKKFLTGADINSIIDEAKKFTYFNNSSSTEKIKYRKEEFKEFLKLAINDSRPHGETDLGNIAECFTNLYENKFAPVSKENIIEFDWFDSEKGIEHVRKDLTCEYDIQLFNTIKNRINEELKNKNKK